TRHDAEIHRPYEEILPIDGIKARALYHLPMTKNPPGGYQQGRGRAGIVPVLSYEGSKLVRVELHPFLHRHDTIGNRGIPYKPDETGATGVLQQLAMLSAPFGTSSIRIADGVGLVNLSQAPGSETGGPCAG